MRFLLVTSVLLSLAGCTHRVDKPKHVTIADDRDASAITFAIPADVVSERVYLGSTNWVHVDETTPWHYGVFDLNKKARVLIELYDPNAWQPVSFKVLRVEADGALTYLGTVDGVDGYAAALLTTKSGGSYVVESVSGSGMSATLALDLWCAKNNGGCSPMQQPGDFCGSRTPLTCDDGLMCVIDEGCGRDDRGGSCARPIEMCPAVVGPTVCGCDGVTYGTGCQANAAGVNVDYTGECPSSCDPSVFEKNTGAALDVAGTWTWKGSTTEYDITATLTLGADGTFAYTQVWDPTCLHIAPFCRRASLLFDMHGTWENLGFAAQLHPEGDNVPPDLAQSFGVEVTCEGMARLTTVENGEDRIFERDRCADTVCADGEHCEMVQVQCITTPCPPQPTCLANE